MKSKMQIPVFRYFLVLTFLFSADLVFAQNYSDAYKVSELGLGSNARALGMGNAFMGVSDDFSAASFNPAGFGLLKRMELAGGINYSKYSNEATFFGNKNDYSNNQTKLDQFSFAFPFPTIRGSLVVAVGYSRDKDFNNALSFNGFNSGYNSMIQNLYGTNDLPYHLYLTEDNGDVTAINGKLQQSGTVISSGGIGKWSFSAAAEVSRRVYLGGSLNVYNGDFKRTRDYYEDDVNNVYGSNVQTNSNNSFTKDFITFYLNDILEWEITGWDAKIGMLYQLNRNVRFGAAIKFPTSYIIKEDYTVTGESIFANHKVTMDEPLESNVEYNVTTPFVFSGGISYNYRWFLASADVSYIDYTQMEFDKSGEDGTLTSSEISANNKDIKNYFTSVFNFNVGVECIIPETNVRMRAGFILNPSAYKDDASKFDKKYLTVGAGFLASESFSFDVAYVYGWWKDIGDNYSSGLSRTYQDVSYNNLIFTVSSRF